MLCIIRPATTFKIIYIICVILVVHLPRYIYITISIIIIGVFLCGEIGVSYDVYELYLFFFGGYYNIC